MPPRYGQSRSRKSGVRRFAIFRAPDAMNEAARERMHNRVFLPSLPGLNLVYII